MKKGKLNLDKKSVAKLTEENLDNVQGGGTFLCSFTCCTNVTINDTTEAPAPTEPTTQSLADPGIFSCK